MADEAPGLSPPWVSHRTLLSQIERMETEGVPTRIDKHFLIGMAGGTQNHFRHALRSLGLIDEDSRPTPLLHDLVEKREERSQLFGNAYFSRFPGLAQLPPNASKSDLFTVLEGYGVKSADQQRKVLAFYVATADYAGMPVSSYIRPTKARTGPRKPGTRRRRVAGNTGGTSSPESKPSPANGTAYEQRDVMLGAAGSVSITVNVRWLDLSDDQFTKLRKLIKDIEALGDSGSSGDSAPAAGTAGTSKAGENGSSSQAGVLTRADPPHNH